MPDSLIKPFSFFVYLFYFVQFFFPPIRGSLHLHLSLLRFTKKAFFCSLHFVCRILTYLDPSRAEYRTVHRVSLANNKTRAQSALRIESLHDDHCVFFVCVWCDKNVHCTTTNAQERHFVAPVNCPNCGSGEVNEALQLVYIAMRLPRAAVKACEVQYFPFLRLNHEVTDYATVMCYAVQRVLHVLQVGIALCRSHVCRCHLRIRV